METAGTTGVVEIQDKEKSYKKKRIQFELGVDIDFAPGKVCILPSLQHTMDNLKLTTLSLFF